MDYRILTPKETIQTVIRVIDTLLSAELPIAGPGRKQAWEDGWGENLEAFEDSGNDLTTLIPKFVKSETMRLPHEYMMPLVPDLETGLVTELRLELFRLFEEADAVYEFGCGTGLNLVVLAQMYPDKKLYGLDWSTNSCTIIDLIARQRNINLTGVLFDMFKPDYGLEIEPNSALFTIGAMEQLGTNFEPFLQFMIDKRFLVCLNIETLYELYDPESLYDFLAIKYLEKRGYLRGYLVRLKELESQGKIEILKVRKGFGCLYHNGYSYVVWRPK